MNDENYLLDLSNFKKWEKIGKGGYGKVYKIEDNQTKQIFAAKISRDQLDFKSKEKFYQYAREVNIISKLNHPSILKFIGFSRTNFKGNPYPVIVTEFEPNGSLDYILELERAECAPEYWNDTKKLINIYGIASAMSYLHSNNILHRDLKPQNILEDDYLFPKIGDFGLSKLYHQNKNSASFQSGTEIKGTFTYIAPEVYKGEKYVSASDVFSFAIIVYEIITNQIPFEEYDKFQFVYAVVNKNVRPKIKKSIGKSYKNLIERCWASNPKDRPSFKQILDYLKTDEGFITDNIDKEDYFSYIRYIDQYHTTFDPRREIIKFDEITKRHSKTFTKISISPYSSFDCDNEDLAFYNQLTIIEGFSELLDETKQILKNCIIQQHSKNKRIIFNYNDTNFLYCNNSLSSFNFINVLKYFEEISIEICEQSIIFDSIFLNVLQIKQNFIQNIKVVLIFNGKKDVGCRFSYNNQINSIQIKPSVTKIENRAFSDCLLLREISMCSTVKSVGEFCFSNCISLKKIDIKSASIIKIENGLFNGCSLLKEITIPFSVEIIGSYAFYGCLSLEKVEMPTTVKSIEYSAFYECKNLKEISLSSSLETIGENAFYGCSSLTEITVPSTVKFIKSRSFHRCSSLAKINLPNSIESIESFTFKECTSLLTFSVPDSVKIIGDSSFFNCLSLIEIIIPNSVEEIGDSCFFGCSSLELISIPNSVQKIGESCFFGCKSLNDITIPSSIDSLSKEIFSKCLNLKRIFIPNSVTNICWYSFNGCSLLNQIEIPLSVTKIGGFSFNDCSNLKKISIPSSVTIIPQSCFKNCFSLEEIFIPNSITKICESSFYRCSSLIKINIPDSVTSIGNSSFFGCSSLVEIKISNSITKIEKESFSRCSNLKNFFIPFSVTCIQNSAFFKCSLLEKIFIPNSVVSIGDSAFSRCASLSEIDIPSSVVSIGKEAFSKCYSIQKIVIPSSVIFIGEKAFLGCLALNDVSIPSATKIIHDNSVSNLRAKTELPFKCKKEEMIKMLKIKKNSKLTFF